MNESLKEKLRSLRLNRLAAHWEEDLKEAARQRLSHAAFLTHVIEEEYRVKCDNAREQRLKRARIPQPYTLETFSLCSPAQAQPQAIQALHDTWTLSPRRRTLFGWAVLALAKPAWRPAFWCVPFSRAAAVATSFSPT